ncbi:MAG: rhodanese-like domain-containing protein [Oscillatoriales cyanobacterium RM2_1_1]|nr:rhodanese-like domain-containing protein [Oscillatoriales cyanobacterium SM2_3_0]NJO47594.1 rhodanese-like domain-containing protein [Oscillatoriales cyanobacterium RM2_1_1]
MLPKPEPMQAKSRSFDLKTRLDWGEPALTIVDVRDLNSFNDSHIQGAISLPIETLVERASVNLEKNRDIYVYGETAEQAEEAVNQLREAGYINLSELVGGLEGWKAVGYPVETITRAK